MTSFRRHIDRMRAGGRVHRRAGASTLDYVLVLGVILPLAAVVLPTGMRIVRLVYDMTAVLIAWPFM